MNAKQDYYMEAVRSWEQSNKNLKHFAECCYHVSNHKTKALADDCGCSPDTVENYRNAYTLSVELAGTEYFRASSEAWEKAHISLWVKAAQLRNRLKLPLEKTWQYLELGVYYKMTRESFAAHVDEAENNTPKWIRRLQNVIRFLKPSRNDYKSELPPTLQERYDKAVAAFVAELEAISQVERQVSET